MTEKTTIQVSKETREALFECRIYPRESYEEILKRLIAYGLTDARILERKASEGRK